MTRFKNREEYERWKAERVKDIKEGNFSQKKAEQQINTPPQKEEDDKPVKYVTGVGGWLRLLIVGLMVLGPLWGSLRLASEFHDAERQFPQLIADSQWSNYKQASWLIFAASAAISFSAGYRLWKIHFPESVRFAILALWLSGPLANFLQLSATVLVFGLQASDSALLEMLGGIFASCIAAGIWTAYLMLSIRVQNTYKMSLSA